MFIDLDLTVEEEFALYATLMGLYRDEKVKSERQMGIISHIYNRLYSEICRFIGQCSAKKYYKGAFCRSELDDYINSAWEEVVLNFYKYNGKNKLTTFLKCYIDGGLRRQDTFDHGNPYYRKKYALGISCNCDELTPLSYAALSIASPDYIEDMPYSDIESSSVEDSVVEMIDDEAIFCRLSCLKPYEMRLLALYSGIVQGYYGRRYTVSMICTDPDLVRLVECASADKISLERIQYRVFDQGLDKYIIKEGPVKHIEPSFIISEIKRLKKVIQPVIG